MSSNKKWYALYTATGYEKKVNSSLTKRKVEYYYPMNYVIDNINDPKRKSIKALFPGFIFVRVEKNDHEQLQQMTGVLSIVHWLREPAVFMDVEIEMIRQFLNVHRTVKPQKIAVNMFDKVKVVGNNTTQEENGQLLVKRKLVQLFLPSLGFILSAEVDSNKMELAPDKFSSQMKTLENTSAII